VHIPVGRKKIELLPNAPAMHISDDESEKKPADGSTRRS